MGFVLGRKPERETLCFSGKAAAAGDEGQLVCEAVAAWTVLTRNRFLQGVLQRAVVHACVCKGCFGICGCRMLQITVNGCMIVVLFCCHVRRYMRVCHVMLQNAL